MAEDFDPMQVQTLDYSDPVALFQRFSSTPGAVLLHSAKRMPGLGRYSYFAVDPFEVLRDDRHFERLQAALERYALEPVSGLPPFQGGAIGYLSYELAQQLETLPVAKTCDQPLPSLVLGLFDVVVAFDHEQQQAWVISSGLPELDPGKRAERAEQRLRWMMDQLAGPVPALDYGDTVVDARHIDSNFSAADYERTIARTIEYIRAGDIFEANITQRFSVNVPDTLTPWHLFTRSCQMNAAPFASYLHFDDVQLASASPERFIKVSNGHVECRPIKGTRPRSSDADLDQHYANELLASVKDRAENIMIVDLMRNDIARVCEDASVQVTELCGLESYATVHHLVSVIEGQLCAGRSIIDLLRATFPGGSITGAPKIRAMEIIAELEPHVRGPYCGNVLCLGFDGYLDSAITIRTFVADATGLVTFHAGGAIVSDSDPSEEYQESLDKAAALRRALTERVLP